MRSQSGSSLSTLVFMVPLLGVPLMAIFGVPQFVPVIASSVSDDAARPAVTRRSRGVGESAAAIVSAVDNTLYRLIEVVSVATTSPEFAPIN